MLAQGTVAPSGTCAFSADHEWPPRAVCLEALLLCFCFPHHHGAPGYSELFSFSAFGSDVFGVNNFDKTVVHKLSNNIVRIEG